MRSLAVQADSFELRKPFTISRGSVTAVEVVTVRIGQAGFVGRGECRPYGRYQETIASVTAQIEEVREAVEGGCSRDELNRLVAPGAARNALDCALWDLDAKRQGEPVWQLAGLPRPHAQAVTYTISLDRADEMAREAAGSGRSLLKLKLGADGDMERMRQIRKAVPDARLIVDANEGWNIDFLCDHAAQMYDLGIELVEQPLPAADDSALAEYRGPVPICADESCHGTGDLAALRGRYRYANVKLDKTGGLSEAIALIRQAQASNIRIMLGCMMASSLAMAPAFLLAHAADYVDLDAPLLLRHDREHAFEFIGENMQPPKPELWG